MYDLNASRVRESRMGTLHSSVARLEEGTALTVKKENGVSCVLPTSGVDGEIFVGLALNNPTTPTVAPNFEEVTVPSTGPYTVQLMKTPIAGKVGVIAMADGTVFASLGSNPTAQKFSQAGNVLTFNSADAGKRVRVAYSYNPTLLEVQTLYGQQMIEDPQGAIGATGFFFDADEIFFTNFDPACNWWAEAPGPLYTGPNGTITLTAGGTKLDKCYVTTAPGVNNPMLGIRLKA